MVHYNSGFKPFTAGSENKDCQYVKFYLLFRRGGLVEVHICSIRNNVQKNPVEYGYSGDPRNLVS